MIIASLNPNHKADLLKSGLSEKTIQESGIHSISDPARIRSILNCSPKIAKSFGSVMVIPFTDLDGRNGYSRIRPDKPRTDSNGRKIKYESPVGEPNQAYIPASVRDKLTTKHELFITEGEKKALKGSQEGFPTIGLVGVHGWKAKGEARLLPTLERIDWRGRSVYVVFDSDIREKPQVQSAESWLCHILQTFGANVKVVRLPDGPIGDDGKPAKIGLDDYLVANGPSDFAKLLESALDPIELEPLVEMLPANKADPATEAKRIIDEATKDGCCRLRFWSGAFWFWFDGKYNEIPCSEVRGIIVKHLNRNYCMVGASAVSNVLEQIKAQTLLPSRTQPPTWLNANEWKTEDIFSTKNSIVHLPSLVAGSKLHSIDATPSLFTTSAVDYRFESERPNCEQWITFLNDLWRDDPDSIQLLQEWFGYMLTPDTRQQKILFMIGPKRSGKGTIARVLRMVVGEGNVSGPTLASLQTNFGLWPLLGKTVAIISDARLSGRSDQAIITERLLSISGEDAQTVDRKMLEPVTTKLLTRFTIISNELPRLNDASGALSGRMLVLQLAKSFYGREDRSLTEKLSEEKSGILHWAIDGWKRLRERGCFTQPASGEQAKQQLDELSSPISAFVAENCQIDDKYQTTTKHLYDAWSSWCNDYGRDPGNLQVFCRDLTAYVPRLRIRQIRIGAARYRAYDGIRLLANHQE